jgi:hypothetical protein
VPIDNHDLIARFMPPQDDEDTFLYTELIDRAKATGGNNRVRVLRTFHHRSRAHFLDVWPSIQRLCDQTGVRAYTRLSPRSYRKVAHVFAELMVEAQFANRYKDMMHLYASACGRSKPIHGQKTWLFDVDAITEETQAFAQELDDKSLLLAIVPSRKGEHIITKPYQIESDLPPSVSLHKDNPTNLYIPDNAA